MSTNDIHRLMEKQINQLKNNPKKSKNTDSSATAVLETGLKCHAKGPKGIAFITDMPKNIGGGDSAPTPGWYMRASMATCNATTIAMKAASEGIELTTLEVTVDSESDESSPLNMRTRVFIGAEGVENDKLLEIIKWAEDNAWVTNAVCRTVPIKTEVKIV